MRHTRPLIVASALAAFLAPVPAAAHDGSHPFKNCTEAYENGYANIPKGDEHYAKRLDRDGDGVGCDKPPADFVPADEIEEWEDWAGSTADSGDDSLAETGGNDATPYLIAGGAAVLISGAALVSVARKRRSTR